MKSWIIRPHNPTNVVLFGFWLVVDCVSVSKCVNVYVSMSLCVWVSLLLSVCESTSKNKNQSIVWLYSLLDSNSEVKVAWNPLKFSNSSEEKIMDMVFPLLETESGKSNSMYSPHNTTSIGESAKMPFCTYTKQLVYKNHNTLIVKLRHLELTLLRWRNILFLSSLLLSSFAFLK